MMTLKTRIRGDRQGVALILVIGMLALMMVIGVTFSIFMRSERTAAGNFRADVQSRELLQVALGRAIDAIEGNVGNAAYPAWDILQSTGSGDLNSNVFTVGSVSNWIPWAVLAATNYAPKWVPVGPQKAQVSWLVLNCSGLIDANYAGGAARASGRSTSEIQLSALSEVGSDPNTAALVAKRRYETIQELSVKAGTGLSGLPRNLITYSFFPTNYEGGFDLALVDVSGNTSNLISRRSDIVTALGKALSGGVTPADINFIYSNLLYYVDSSSLPLDQGDLGTPLTKAVPLINEVRVTTRALPVVSQFTTLVQIDVEWFYPFVKPSPESFDIVCDAQFSPVAPTLAKYVPAPIVGQSQVSSYGGVAGPVYGKVTFSKAVAPPVNYSTGDVIRLAYSIGVQVKRHSDAAVVDSVPYPYVQSAYFAMTNLSAITLPTTLSADVRGFECVDPRFNWDTKLSGSQWTPYTPMNPNGTIQPAGVNWITTRLFPNQYYGMHIAGEPLHNVCELSHLLRGMKTSDKWTSIRVYTNSGAVDRVLDYFYVSQVSTNRRGLVNVNSHSLDVLKSVYLGLPLESYAGAGGAQVTADQAASLAAALQAQTQSPISRMSDYVTNTAFFSVVDPGGTLTPFQQQAVFRASADLFHFRQNYFVVLLYTRPTGSGSASATSVAEIWRDPVANSQGQHPWFARQFKVLNN